MSRMLPARRRVARAIGASGILAVAGVGAGCSTTRTDATSERSRGRVVVVGGGFGGATAARYLKHWGGAEVQVVLVEREARHLSGPQSNLVLGGSRRVEDMTLGYDGLRAVGVTVRIGEVIDVDPVARTVTLDDDTRLPYDRLIVSPGIAFRHDDIEGLDADARRSVLHAWASGPQVTELRRRIEAMRDGGTVLLSIPPAPYRCPAAPYERACQIAFHFRQAKLRARVLVLDANEDIQSKKGLFLKAWEAYRGIVEYRPNARVVAVDARSGTVVTEFGERIRADVLNVIPPHGAGEIARRAGLATVDDRWCGVDWLSMESLAAPGIHVLGDAVAAAPAMPRTAHMANQHGKVAAAAILELLRGRTPLPATMTNTCYSWVDDRNVIHVSSVHRYEAGPRTMEPVAGAGGLSTQANALEGQYASAWARNLWRDTFNS